MPVVGPAFGGYLTDAISWRWAFYINIPVGMLALLLQSKFLQDTEPASKEKAGKFDGVGFGLLGLWIGCLQFVLDKGQEDDWFSDARVCWAAGIMTVTFVIFLLREFRDSKPLVDLRAFGNRNLPVFFQTLLGYSATASGFSVSPRGLGSVAASLLVGAAVSKFDPRWITALGFATLGISCVWIGNFTTDIGPYTEFWPIAMSGAGLAMIFVPLSQVALGTIGKKGTGNASGIFNFLRNVGGSIGISAANTISQRHLQTHRNQLVHNISGASWILRKQLLQLGQELSPHAGYSGRTATLRAYSMTNTTVNSQAQLYAYVDVFRYFGLICLLAAPFAFFLTKPSADAGPGAA